MKKIALIGGGPAALFMYKRIVDASPADAEIHIFEQHEKLGALLTSYYDGEIDLLLGSKKFISRKINPYRSTYMGCLFYLDCRNYPYLIVSF